jgi:uncharacterized RDD family membrane protein YckC
VGGLNVRLRVQTGFWRGLEAIGIKDAHERWEKQSPFLQRAVPPLIIAGVVILVLLPWRAPDPAFLVLLAITYAVYLLPRRVRRFALPLTVLGLAVAYPSTSSTCSRCPSSRRSRAWTRWSRS